MSIQLLRAGVPQMRKTGRTRSCRQLKRLVVSVGVTKADLDVEFPRFLDGLHTSGPFRSEGKKDQIICSGCSQRPDVFQSRIFHTVGWVRTAITGFFR